jgi:hypothetical protein
MSRNGFIVRWAASSFAIAFSVLTLPSQALAQTSAEKAASAQALFDEGLRLMNAGQPASACPKFAASQKLDPGMGTKFRLAECYEKIDKTASAWALFIEIGDEARGAKRPDREKIARKRADDLAPKLARMTVLVAPDTAKLAGLEVRRDGTLLEKAVWDVAMPIDPGEHLLTATAPGKTAWESKPVVAQASKTVEVTIPRLADAPKAPVLAAFVPAAPVAVEKRSVVPAVVLGGVALVAAGMGGALFVVSGNKKTSAMNLAGEIVAGPTPHCSVGEAKSGDDSRCDELISTARAVDTFHDAAIGLFVGASVTGAAAVVYLLLPPPAVKRASVQGLRATPIVGPGQAGFLLSGAF